LSHVPSTRTNPQLTFEVNVVGTFNLLESLRQLGSPARIVLVSSGNLYGNIDSGEDGFNEESPVHATSPYASTKLIGEQLAHSYVADFGLRIIIARPFNHTGPGQPPTFVCPEFARAIGAAIVRGGPVHIRTGSLDPRRDISDVRDVVRAYAMLAQKGSPGQTYNVCSGSMIAIGEIVRILGALGNVSVTTELDPSRLRIREILRSGGNCSKIHRELGWRPEIPITKTLRDLLDYWVERARMGVED
jgi:GDP-4-dehydro-6-deoxy-D-mannose reductase